MTSLFDDFISRITTLQQSPFGSAITENMARVDIGLWSFDINALDENLSAAPVIKSFTVDSIYRPSYNETYVELVDGAFEMISAYEVPESVESAVNYGRMSVLSINTEQFKSVGSMEVSIC